ncbi:hypothetical protein [Methylobacterium sp. A54F]
MTRLAVQLLGPGPQRPAHPGPADAARSVLRAVATYVLAWTTGLPPDSARHLMPEPDGQAGPCLGF